MSAIHAAVCAPDYAASSQTWSRKSSRRSSVTLGELHVGRLLGYGYGYGYGYGVAMAMAMAMARMLLVAAAVDDHSLGRGERGAASMH